MDWFEAAFWVTMLGGLVAVVVPAYWLALGWWQDRERPDKVAAPSPIDLGTDSINKALGGIHTAGD